MKAAVFQGAGLGLSVEEVPDPTPGDRQVVVAVGACGICGTDLTITSGHGVLAFPRGATPGHEFGGEVVAVGPGVESISIGDHVVAMAIRYACGRCDTCRAGTPQWCTAADKVVSPNAGYSEFALIGEPQAVPVPRSMTWRDAALVEPLAVGLHGVDLSGMRPGDDVVVIGPGPIGLAAVFWARRLGARRIVVIATSRRREKFAMALGASSFVVAGEDTVAEAVESAGGPPPIVFEAAGAPGALAQAVEIARARGTVVVLSCCTVADSFIPARALLKELRVQFSDLYTTGDYDHTIRTLEADPIGPRPMVTRTIGLADLPATFEALRGPTDECKVQVDPRI